MSLSAHKFGSGVTLAVACALLLGGCGDHGRVSVADETALPKSLSGTVGLHSGAALSGATVQLLSSSGEALATTTTDNNGRYQFAVNAERFRIRADFRFAGGAQVSAAAVANLRGPLAETVEPIVLPDLRDQALLVLDGIASNEQLSISGLPPQLDGLWAAAFEAGDDETLPGDPETANDAFSVLGHYWFAAVDQNGHPLTQFTPALQVTVPVSAQAQALIRDQRSGSGQIDVSMVSFDDQAGRWQEEADAVLVDAGGNLIAESQLGAVNDGSFIGEVLLRFSAPHFSAYAAALFFRNGAPDWNDANAAPEIKALRPQLPFNSGNNYEDFWLGAAVGSSEAPLFGDPADDGLVTCGSQTWVQASYKVAPGSGSVRPAYLQVFQISGDLSDADGQNNGTAAEFDSQSWVGRNIEINNWDGQGIVQSAFLQIAPGIDELGVGTTGGIVNHRNGYLRLVLTPSRFDPDADALPGTLEMGEVEDYLDSCRFLLSVRVSGEAEDRVSAKSRSCAPGAACEVALLEDETIVLNATRGGAPIDVDWSISRRGANTSDCPRGPSCSYQRQASVVNLRSRGPQLTVGAAFPLDPRLNVSVTGRGQVQAQAGGLNCDARDPAARPSAEDCRASFAPGSTVTLQATPAAQHLFARWAPLDCIEGSQTGLSCSFVVVADQRLRQQAVFEPFPVLSLRPGAGGSVLSSPAGIDCDGSADAGSDPGCSAPFAPGTEITLEAQGNDQGGASSWTGPCLGVIGNICRFTINADAEVAVNFGDAAGVQLQVQGQGTVRSDPEGLNCDSSNGSCAQRFALGTRILLSAEAADDFQFTGWSGICASFLGNSECGFDLDQDQQITASFGELFDWQVQVSGNGAVDGAGSIFACTPPKAGTADCQERYVDGRSLSFFASPDAGNEFVGWGGACAAAGGATTCNVTATADAQVTAEFRPQVVNHRLTLMLGGTPGAAGDSDELLFCDTASQSCSRNYAAGSRVELWAMADDANHGYRWGEACSGTPDNSNCVIQGINSPLNVTVEFFEPAPVDDPRLTVTFAGDGEGMVSDDQFRLTCSSDGSNPDCAAQYAPGTQVGLSATPLSTGDVFLRWLSPAACVADANNPNCTVTMNADLTATAEFGLE